MARMQTLMTTKQERDLIETFGERYRISQGAPFAEMERSVIGGDWGANGYTTMAQADELGELAELSPGRVLLDLGGGGGWPGLYLAATTGCSVVVTDLSEVGLRVAATRANREGLRGRFGAVVASGRRQPFKQRSFDAVIHTDVLC